MKQYEKVEKTRPSKNADNTMRKLMFQQKKKQKQMKQVKKTELKKHDFSGFWPHFGRPKLMKNEDGSC